MRKIKLKVILATLILAMLVPGFDVSANSGFSERWEQTIEGEYYSYSYVTKEGHVLLEVSEDDANVFYKYDGATGKQLSSFELSGPSQILRDKENNLFVYYFDTDTYQIHLYDDEGKIFWKQQYPKLDGEAFGEYFGFDVSINNNLLNISKAYRDVRSYSLSDGSLVSVSPFVEDPRNVSHPSVELNNNTIIYRDLNADGEIEEIHSIADIPDYSKVVETLYSNNDNQITLYIKTEDVMYGNKEVIRKIFDEHGQVKNTTFIKYRENFHPYTLRDFIYLDHINLSHELIHIGEHLKFYDREGSLVNSTDLQTTDIDVITGIDKKYLFIIASQNAYLFKNNGELMWKSDISMLFDGEGLVSFVQPTNQIDPTKVYIKSEQKIIQLDKRDGTLLWTYDVGKRFRTPTIHEPSNTLFYMVNESDGQKLYAINTAFTQIDMSSKVWTVKFNEQVDPAYIKDSEYIYVKNSNGTRLENILEFEADGEHVLIRPPSGNYKPGSYTIIVLDSVKSVNGKKLNKSYSKEFVVK